MLLTAVEKLVIQAVVGVGALVLFQLDSLLAVGLVVISVVRLHVDGVYLRVVLAVVVVKSAIHLLHVEEVRPCSAQRRRLIQIVVHSILPHRVLEVVADRVPTRNDITVDDVSSCVVVFDELFDLLSDHLVPLILALYVDVRSSKLL